jgi:hypothetical protein
MSLPLTAVAVAPPPLKSKKHNSLPKKTSLEAILERLIFGFKMWFVKLKRVKKVYGDVKPTPLLMNTTIDRPVTTPKWLIKAMPALV